MPQMAPLSWIMLFMLFSIIMMMFMISNYFIIYYKPAYLNYKTKLKKTIYWKW